MRKNLHRLGLVGVGILVCAGGVLDSASAGSHGNRPVLSFEVSTNKPAFRIYEPIVATVIVKNQGTQAVTFSEEKKAVVFEASHFSVFFDYLDPHYFEIWLPPVRQSITLPSGASHKLVYQFGTTFFGGFTDDRIPDRHFTFKVQVAMEGCEETILSAPTRVPVRLEAYPIPASRAIRLAEKYVEVNGYTTTPTAYPDYPVPDYPVQLEQDETATDIQRILKKRRGLLQSKAIRAERSGEDWLVLFAYQDPLAKGRFWGLPVSKHGHFGGRIQKQ